MTSSWQTSLSPRSAGKDPGLRPGQEGRAQVRIWLHFACQDVTIGEEQITGAGFLGTAAYLLEVLDELNHLNVEFISFRENIDTGGALGRAVVVIIGAIAELERNLIVERVRAGMRRAKLEGRHIGRPALEVDRQALIRDHQTGMSLRQVAKMHGISRASVARVLQQPVDVEGAA